MKLTNNALTSLLVQSIRSAKHALSRTEYELGPGSGQLIKASPHFSQHSAVKVLVTVHPNGPDLHHSYAVVDFNYLSWKDPQ